MKNMESEYRNNDELFKEVQESEKRVRQRSVEIVAQQLSGGGIIYWEYIIAQAKLIADFINDGTVPELKK